MKSGLYTTEFWLTAAHFVGALLVALGVLSSDEADALVGPLAKMLAAAALLLGPALSISAYSRSRAQVKGAHNG